MVRILVIGLGGFIGSVLRYLINSYIHSILKSFDFPYGTLSVNVIGCLILGFLAQLADGHAMFSSQTRVFLFIGILGGFTTFSAFGHETLNLIRNNEQVLATINISAHVVLGLTAVWSGRTLAHFIWR